MVTCQVTMAGEVYHKLHFITPRIAQNLSGPIKNCEC